MLHLAPLKHLFVYGYEYTMSHRTQYWPSFRILPCPSHTMSQPKSSTLTHPSTHHAYRRFAKHVTFPSTSHARHSYSRTAPFLSTRASAAESQHLPSSFGRCHCHCHCQCSTHHRLHQTRHFTDRIPPMRQLLRPWNPCLWRMESGITRFY